ncbi:MAG: dTDP-glucose 4,6-dehydratase [Gammaproteobacteria bacterium]
MSRILVTGGAGFIGANFTHYAMKNISCERLIVLDALTYAGDRESLQALEPDSRYSFVHGDIKDKKQVVSLLQEESIDTVVHFAAESHVDRSIHGPDEFISTNIVGTNALLAAAREVWLTSKKQTDSHRFHHVSTDEVYGSLSSTDPKFIETTPFSPNSPYAASKAASDHLVRAYNKTYGLNTFISNCSNNYGPFQFPEKLIPLMLVNILQGKALPIYGDGQNVRDWLHVEDHCRAIDLILSDGKPGETYNVGGENEYDNLSLVKTLCAVIDEKFKADTALAQKFPNASPANNKESAELIEFVTDRAGHDRRYAVDPGKLKKELGFELKHSFSTGLAATVDWYLANSEWWQHILDGSYRDWIDTQYG